ncbi:hypothetical protein [Nocardia sp. NPDC004604]|uniref:hypothetical protein n=1 Tax=Nocardia sp. NPDC004604 TaxID=3157013 RepID=UPI0033AA3024
MAEVVPHSTHAVRQHHERSVTDHIAGELSVFERHILGHCRFLPAESSGGRGCDLLGIERREIGAADTEGRKDQPHGRFRQILTVSPRKRQSLTAVSTVPFRFRELGPHRPEVRPTRRGSVARCSENKRAVDLTVEEIPRGSVEGL